MHELRQRGEGGRLRLADVDDQLSDLEAKVKRLAGKVIGSLVPVDGRYPEWCLGPDGLVHYVAQRSLVTACQKFHWTDVEASERCVDCLDCASKRYGD